MKLHIDFDKLKDLDEAGKKKHVFHAIKGALVMLPMALDYFGEQDSMKLAAVQPSLIKGADVRHPELRDVAAYLTGDKAAKFFGQKWAVPADTPTVLQVAGRFIDFYRDNLRDVDLGWQGLFRFIDQRNSGNDSIDVVNSSTAIAFEQTPNGGQIKINRNISASTSSLKMITYTGGVSFLDDWFRFNKWYQVQEAAEDMLNAWAKMVADNHYALITAVGSGSNVAFNTDDQTTFNAAVSGMFRALEAKAYNVSGNPQVDIVCAPEKIGRVLAMLEASRGSMMLAFGTANQPIAFGVRNIIQTTRVAAADNNYYVVLPERKIKCATWTDFTIASDRAEDFRATDWYGHGQFNAIVGEQDQVRRVALS